MSTNDSGGSSNIFKIGLPRSKKAEELTGKEVAKEIAKKSGPALGKEAK